jgi:hypothetical protein
VNQWGSKDPSTHPGTSFAAASVSFFFSSSTTKYGWLQVQKAFPRESQAQCSSPTPSRCGVLWFLDGIEVWGKITKKEDRGVEWRRWCLLWPLVSQEFISLVRIFFSLPLKQCSPGVFCSCWLWFWIVSNSGLHDVHASVLAERSLQIWDSKGIGKLLAFYPCRCGPLTMPLALIRNAETQALLQINWVRIHRATRVYACGIWETLWNLSPGAQPPSEH